MSSLSPVTLKLSGKVIPNRIYRTALSEYSGSYDENDVTNTGKPLPRYIELHQELANGGAGLICFGNIPVHRDHLENFNNVVLDRDQPWDAVESFRPAILAAKSRGALCLPQLNFTGRQCPEFLNPNPVSSSDVKLHYCMDKSYGQPTPLSKAQIRDIIDRFVWAAETVVKAGADGIILHAAHGYLINQFLSPHINKRIDEYGGSIENRARFVVEIVESIKARLPTDRYIIGAKINCQDFVCGGATFAEQCVVIKLLEAAGVDFFDISGGTYEAPAWRGNLESLGETQPPAGEGTFLKWARDIKKILSRAVVGTTSGWRDSELMMAAVRRGDIDMCGLGRPLRDDPDLPNRVFTGERIQSKL
ncbi:uncharacterized protein BJX67DRAFT_370052 [Aspergillus lucknowensis]|uniref:NADH:flavin oxidoreductase/NADH oxidase N-terminal domain-containing protein n=1 Tax=Aspergillus lucknowensis TaxID=176173 RepID=A0ABR4M3V0_9EURO